MVPISPGPPCHILMTSHQVGRIPIPSVRQIVVEKVARQAQQEHIACVDVAFFERAATF